MASYLFDLITSRIPSTDKVFIETLDNRKIIYGDLLDGSARFANALVKLGVVPGDRVAVQVEKSPEAILLYLACLRTG